MFERISNGFSIARSSWRVLMLDKEMLLFPIFSGIAALLVLASFATPFIMHPEWLQQNQQQIANNPVYWVGLFAFYTCNYFVIVFFNAALVSCALMRFAGQDPTVSDGLRAASGRLPQILAWSLLSATVGVVLRLIESQSEKVGAIVSSLLGAAWTVCTYFVVPVLVVEKAGPLEAFRRSAAILRKTWGESLGGEMGMGLFIFLLMLPGIALLVGGAVAFNTAGVVVAVCLIAAGFAVMALASALSSALQGIFIAAMYQYAARGEVPEAFDGDILQSAFRPKQ